MLDYGSALTFTNGFRFQWEKAQQCFVLLYPEGMVKLNDTAGEILQLVDSKKSTNDLVDLLTEKFGGEASIKQDVQLFVEDAVEKNWLTIS